MHIVDRKGLGRVEYPAALQFLSLIPDRLAHEAPQVYLQDTISRRRVRPDAVASS